MSGVRSRCPSCGADAMRVFHEQHSVPTNSCLLLDSLEEAQGFPRGRIQLELCEACGFIANTAFDAGLAEYSDRYEETQAFSPRFMAFARDLARQWVERYALQGKDVLEIGCGKGEFLVLMCELGAGRGVGIDPGYHPERTTSEVADRLTFIRDFYSERYADLTGDAVVCRHTLEHIQPVQEFLATVRRGIGDRRDTAVLFELPDTLRVLREVAFWDVYYEHCSYFTAGSLARLFRRTGFDVVDLSLDFDDQYLLLEASPGTGEGSAPLALEHDLDDVVKAVDHFESTYPTRVEEWRADLRRHADAGRRVVIWGAGSKGVAYLTTLGVRDEIEYAVDVNPFKHGKYMAGTGQRIVAPELLKEYRPDVVIVMNAIYRDEIAAKLAELGVDAELVTV